MPMVQLQSYHALNISDMPQSPLFHINHHIKVLNTGPPYSEDHLVESPSFSPASTAGLVRIILFTSLLRKAVTAMATAKKVLPVPAGPTPKTISFRFIASIYVFCP